MNINEIINNKDQLLIENYFDLQEKVEKKYGQNTLVFIEIGSFYEIYQYDNIGKAEEISKTLNIVLTKKNKNISSVSLKNPYLCGIPTVSLERFLQKLISENKWTIVLIKQEGYPPNISRTLSKIISPGTNIDYIDNDDNIYIASIFLDKNNQNVYSIGLSLIDITIGTTIVYENYGLSNDKEITIDETSQILSNYNVSEAIITSSINNIEEIKNKLIKHNIPIVIKTEEDVKETININYQNELLKHSYKTESQLSAIEELNLERMPFTTNSLSILLEFIIEHNKLIGTKLQKPKQIYSSKYMYMGNNPIQQLDIYNKEEIDVLDIVNKGISAIGRRFIKEQLLNPLTSKEEINKRYKESKLFINNPKRKKIEDKLKGIYDIERILRKCEIETIQPFEFSNLYNSLRLIQEIESLNNINDFLFYNIFLKLEKTFDFNIMSMSNLTNITKTFIRENISKDLDKVQKELINLEAQKDLGLSSYFNLKESEMEGLYLEITNKKYNEVKNELNKFEIDNIRSLKNSKKIFLKELNKINEKHTVLTQKLIKLTKEIFIEKIKELNINLIREKIEYICEIEFYINNAKLYEEKAYTIPNIEDFKDNFYEAEELRHPIVESIENEIFIPNNVQFGKKENMQLDTSVLFNKNQLNGFLLYGQNSSGKTVLSKSIGISIILAQAGFFVPAKTLRYSIFKSLFTRISGNDNLSKGLSTFAVEMIELKNILNRANEKSLIIGDEISHGTETVSGLSIVASTVLSLYEKNSSFVIATHLHQLSTIEDIEETKSISSVHLSLQYNEEKDELKYNRKLQKGRGSSIYGLEFAKSLKMPRDFLEKAYKIRKNIAEDLSGLEELTKKRKSKYNSKVYIGICSQCGEKAEEVHHINEQNKANKNGLIGHFNKNNKANLKPLCKECHKKEHF